MAAEPSRAAAAPPKPAPEPQALLLPGGWPCAACTMANAAHAAACALCYAPRSHKAPTPCAAEESPRALPPLADLARNVGDNNGGRHFSGRLGPLGPLGGGSVAGANGTGAGAPGGGGTPRLCAACGATKGRGDFSKTQW